MATIDDLFVGVCGELNERTSVPTPYNAIKASALLRQLLLDGQPLIHAVNTKHRLHLLFRVRMLKNIVPKPGLLAIEGIVPGPKDDEASVERIKLDQFLKLRTFIFHTTVFTVQDAIKTTANIRGGVHWGKPESMKEVSADALISQGPKLGYAGGTPMDTLLAMIPAISSVVIETCAPLVERIRRDQASSPQHVIEQ